MNKESRLHPPSSTSKDNSKGKGKLKGDDEPEKHRSRHELCGDERCGGGGSGCFRSTAEAVLMLELRVWPRPEPDITDPSYDEWMDEYITHWRDATCPCLQGFFCRSHGRWIAGARLDSSECGNLDRQGHPQCDVLGLHGPGDVSPPPPSEKGPSSTSRPKHQKH
ncbi:hypothetical protein MN608_00083 [Microdochium nivale]|nr:hypothetical protein MN608_00083 [Microdochium nivale]